MFTEITLLQQLDGQTLDAYLSKGWYRMQHAIFTTHALKRDEKPLTAIWLRNCLDQWETPSSYIKLQKRNKRFRLEIGPLLALTENQSDLFKAYRRVTFGDREASLQDYLMDADGNHPFNSYCISCYDGDELIGCGIFDLGHEAAAGIVSFYDRQYDAHSLGRYMIYAMIEYCKEQGFRYFYPGYVVPGDKAFDYKLQIGADTIEFYRFSTGEWLSWQDKDEQDDLVFQLRQQLERINTVLQHSGQNSALVYYEHFDLATSLMMRGNAFDHPYFIRTDFPAAEGMEVIVTSHLLTQEIMAYEIPANVITYSDVHEMLVYNGIIAFQKNA